MQAQDHAGNLSALSDPITVSTQADVEPPSAPTNLTTDGGGGIYTLQWRLSTDNADSADYLQYDVYADGTRVYVARGYENSTVVCLDPGTHTFWVRARDRSGNVSPSSNLATVSS